MPQGPQPCRVEELLEHTEWVRRLAYSLVRCEATADDLVQQTFLAALEHPPTEQGATRGWLARVMRNIAIDRSRRRLRRQMREEWVAEQAGTAQSDNKDLLPVEIQARVELQELLASAVKDLPDPYRTTTVLYYFDDLTSAQIAKKLKLNPSTVRNQLRRAREQIRVKLEGRYGDQWATMCFGLLLRPFSASSTLLPVGWTALMKPLAMAAVASAGLWLWQPLQPATVNGGHEVGAVHEPTSTVAATGHKATGQALNPSKRSADKGDWLHQMGIEVVDTDGSPLADAQCRVYAMRRPVPPHELLGPEALRLAPFPVLASGATASHGIAQLNLPTPSADAPEPQLCVVAEKAGYTKRALLLRPTPGGDRFHSQIQIQLQRGIQRSFVVVDEASQPVAEARLMASRSNIDRRDPQFQSYFASADGDGLVQFQSLHAQVDSLRCWAPGFQTTHIAWDGQVHSRDSPLTIMLRRGQEADLTVRAGGQAFAGARVFLRQGDLIESTLHGSREEEGFLGETDNNGYLRVAGIDPQLRSDLYVKIGGVERRVISIEEQGQYRVDFPPIRQIRGRALLADGTPASYALVMIVDPLALSTRHLTTAWADAEGHFHLSMKAGMFAYAIIHPSGTLLRQDLQAASGDLVLGDQMLPPASPLQITLTDADDLPLSGDCEIKLLRNPQLAAPQFGRPQLLGKIWATGLQTVLPLRNSPNTFTLRHLPPGEYWLRLRAPGYVDQLKKVVLPAAGTEQSFALAQGHTAQLRVVDGAGQALSNRRLVLSPADYDWNWQHQSQPQRPLHRPQSGNSKASGHLSFRGLAPGKWRLSLPEFSAHGHSLAEFEITNDCQLGDVEVPAMGGLVVSTQSSDRLYAQSQIQVLTTASADEEGQAWRTAVRTGGDGRTEMIELIAGEYLLRSLVLNTMPRQQRVVVEPSQIKHQSVQLGGTNLRGRLPAGVENSQVILVQRGSTAAAADIHKRMRKVVRHPPLPGLGGTLVGRSGDDCWAHPYASAVPAADGTFAFHSLPDGDYWLMASANGHRIAGPFDLAIGSGRIEAASLADDFHIDLQRGSGFRIFAPQLLPLLQQYPDARLQAKIEAGPPLDGPPSNSEASARKPLRIELAPADGPLFEINKDRPRRYQITYIWSRGGRAAETWTQQIETQTGVIQDLYLNLPE